MIHAFSGTTVLPASASVPSSRWDANQIVLVGFTTALTYGSGNLCLEIRGAPASGTTGKQWPIDAVRTDHDGSAVEYGTNCAGFAANPSEATLIGATESMRLVLPFE